MAKLKAHGSIIFTAQKDGVLDGGTPYEEHLQIMEDRKILKKVVFIRDGKRESSGYTVFLNNKGKHFKISENKTLDQAKEAFAKAGYSITEG
jgi:hypothetical protein